MPPKTQFTKEQIIDTAGLIYMDIGPEDPILFNVVSFLEFGFMFSQFFLDLLEFCHHTNNDCLGIYKFPFAKGLSPDYGIGSFFLEFLIMIDG